FLLLLNKKIRIENDDSVFSVYLPLNNYIISNNERTDS
ncbi:Sensor histidine kinase YehU, partial [termite gut metagenome]